MRALESKYENRIENPISPAWRPLQQQFMSRTQCPLPRSPAPAGIHGSRRRQRAPRLGRPANHGKPVDRAVFEGDLYAVNPGYDSICGVPCYPRPAITARNGRARRSDRRRFPHRGALDDVIAHGARAATMMSSLVLEDDQEPLLRERVSAKIESSGLLVCGANGMGFYNCSDGVWVCGFDTRQNHARGGNVT